MKKKQVNAILVDQAKRKKKIFNYSCIIGGILLIAVLFFSLFVYLNKPTYVSYHEKSNLDYQVYLKQNPFFTDKYLQSNNQYIASLIDYINANFNYKLNVDNQDVNFQYAYKVVANVSVTDKNTHKSLYDHSESLIEEDYVNFNGKDTVNLNQEVKINYNHYNNLIKRFVGAYDLDNVECTLDINMYVNVKGDCDSISKRDTESVISLSIPLTTKTVAIDMAYNVVNDDTQKLMLCETPGIKFKVLIVIAIVLVLVALYYIYKLIKYIVSTRTAESIYEKELKNILNNYKSYIQKVSDNFDFRGYKVLKIETFTDMLEIRDTIQQPILMVENKNKTGVYFFIPSKTKMIYSYCLKVSDIKKNLAEQNEKK